MQPESDTSKERSAMASRAGFPWTLCIAMVALVCGHAVAGDSPRGEKYALLVGVTNYNPNELRNLKFADKDVTALAEVLKSGGCRPENIRLMTHEEGAKSLSE